MTTLITGGTGKTGLILAQLLTDAGRPALLTSRKGEAPAPYKAVVFNWFDQTTFENPFNTDSKIDRVYIVSPPGVHPGPIAKPFIDLAIAKGVKRFVLLGASYLTAESESSGEIEKILKGSGVDYVVLKPTWFQDNFGTTMQPGIRQDSVIRSSMGDGAAAFVSTRDIAEAAFASLTAESVGPKEVLVFGPDLLTYDDAANLLSSAIGRKVTHIKLSPEQMVGGYVKAGLPQDYAKFLVWLEQGTRSGKDKQLFESDPREKWFGKHSLSDYFKENKKVWMTA